MGTTNGKGRLQRISNNNKTNNNKNKIIDEEERSSHRSSTSSTSNASSTTRSKQPQSSPTIAGGKQRDSFAMGNQATEQRMSDLSIMMSNFIVDSATKTYDGIGTEEEQAEFLRDMSTAVRGSVIAPAGGYVENDEHYLEDITKNGKRNSDVVRFLVDASNGAMEAMDTETEKNAFKQHLRNNLRMRFRLQRERAEHRRSQQQQNTEQDDDNHHEQHQHDYSSNRHHRRSVWVHEIPSSSKEDRNYDIDDDDDISL